MKTLEQRFWEKVEYTETCWLWRASKRNKGYGQFGLCRDGYWMISAHRMSYMLCVGEIPKGLHVLHTCDNPSCVNPSHLFLGTNADNVADKVAKGRQARSRGENHPMARLTIDEVKAIRQDRRVGHVIAKEYGVSGDHVNRIRRGARWS